MGLISSGISKVRAFLLPAGIWADGKTTTEVRVSLVKWHSEWEDMLYQIYVNGEYAGCTFDTRQRKMIVHIRPSFKTATRIEVYAVRPYEAHLDLSAELNDRFNQSGRARISWLRSQRVPAGATAHIYSDNGSGSIDYEHRLTSKPECIWPSWLDKGGFGLSNFGRSDFGFDGSAAVGFGKGLFGAGEFGLDADLVSWMSPELEAGTYKFAVRITDAFGNQDEDRSETEPVAVIPAAAPAKEVTILSFDKDTGRLVLSVS